MSVDQRVAPARHVRVAVPAYTGSISVQTAHALCGALPLLTGAGLKVDTDFLAGSCYLDHARNIMVSRFLASDAQDLVFIDADVGFEPSALVQLCKADRPVIAGIYPKKTDDTAFPVTIDADEIWSDEAGLIECAGLPTGFMRINRGVFEAMAEHVPEYTDPAYGAIRAYFQCVVRPPLYWGEDFEFCRRWREIGGQLWAIPDLDFGHVGSKEWRNNWGRWLLGERT